MNHEFLKISGRLQIVVTDEFGNLKQEVTIPNLVVNTGKAFIAESMRKTTTNTPVAMTHMALGTGTTAAAATQTALVTEISTRATVTASGVTTTVTNDTTQYVATFGAGVATGAITEAGIFNASTAGTMLCRTVFPVVNKGAGDSITITWKVTIS